MRKVYKVYTRCEEFGSQTDYFDDAIKFYVDLTVNGLWVSNGVYDSLPSWFTVVVDGIGNAVGYTFDPANVAIGEYVISFAGSDGNEYLLVIQIVDECNVFLPFDNQCCDAYNLVWLNREGGYENYYFGGKNKVFEVEAGEEISFKNANLEKKFAQKKDMFRGVQAGTGRVPKSHRVKIESLRNSIQAWVFNESLPLYVDWTERFTPIYLDFGSFVVFDTSNKVFEANIRFLIAKELLIQTQ